MAYCPTPAHQRYQRICKWLAGLLLGSLLFSCAEQKPPVFVPSGKAALLAGSNRLDKVLAMTEEGWRFSGLLARNSKGKDRFPFLLLLRAPAPRAATSEAPAALEALLLTETGVQLCYMRLMPESRDLLEALPGETADLCRAVVPALKRLFLQPQPDAGGTVYPGDHGPELHDSLGHIFRFSAQGVLRAKESRTMEAWSASYSAHIQDGISWLPRSLQYRDNTLELRLARLIPETP